MKVQRFEYYWAKNPASMPVILLQEETYRKHVESIFAKAITNQYQIRRTAFNLTIKKLNPFQEYPKFKTELAEKSPTSLYLFLQIFERFQFHPGLNDNDIVQSSSIEIKCRILDGVNGSALLDKTFTVDIHRDKASAGQIILTRLPAHPAVYISAFDSIASWIFQPADIALRELYLEPACMYSAKGIPAGVIRELDSFELTALPQKIIQTRRRPNRGGNVASGAISLITGVGISKSKSADYRAIFPFIAGSDTVKCVIDYRETVTADRTVEKTRNDDGSQSVSTEAGEYGAPERYTDPNENQFIMVGRDTIGWFTLSYEPSTKSHQNQTQYWNGKDSSSIGVLNDKWKNFSAGTGLTIWGRTKDKQFRMQGSSEMQAKMFYIEEYPALMTIGKDGPVKAYAYHELTPEQLRIFIALASIPFGFFQR
ncbi:hypothetical protein HY58_15555 [Flavihumibacter sp. ZG627]|nr:hypothetical protein HY58_15555 [Flavihumibacter sp. ZG627]